MRIRWYGQSAFLLRGAGRAVLIDPFRVNARIRFPEIRDVAADLVLITHGHFDHDNAEAAAGEPLVLRGGAGRFESPVGEVVAVASEHDGEAGTVRGPNTLFSFALDGVRVAHLGDLGQPALRPEQARALGDVDLLFVPVGGGPTLDGAQAAEVVRVLRPRWIVPMHYGTPAIESINLAPADDFLGRFSSVRRYGESEVALPEADGPVVLVPQPPG